MEQVQTQTSILTVHTQQAKQQHKDATIKFDYTSIVNRLCVVGVSDHRNSTGVVMWFPNQISPLSAQAV